MYSSGHSSYRPKVPNATNGKFPSVSTGLEPKFLYRVMKLFLRYL